MTWSALEGETLISLSPGHPHQQLIDRHLAKAGVKVQSGLTVNLLDTQIALVEAEEGIAIIPPFGMPACRNRMITTSQLINPVVHFDFHMISRRGIELPPGALEFTAFLRELHCVLGGARRRALSLGVDTTILRREACSTVGRVWFICRCAFGVDALGHA